MKPPVHLPLLMLLFAFMLFETPCVFAQILDHEEYDLKMTRGIALVNQKRYAEAELSFRAALNAHPQDARAIHLLGVVEGKQGKFLEAEEDLRFALTLSPLPLDAYLDLGIVYHQQKKYQDALDMLAEGERAGAKNPLIYFYQGKVYQEMGQPERAAPRFLRAAAMATLDHPDLIPVSRYHAGIAFFQQKIIAEAKDEFLAVLEQAPDSEIGRSSKEYLTRIARMESVSDWQMGLSIGYQYDDNVILEPTDLPLSTPPSKKQDGRIVLFFNSLIPYRKPLPWGGGGGYTLYQSLHQTLDRFNTTSHQPFLYLVYEKNQTQLRGDYRFDFITLDGKAYLNNQTVRIALLQPAMGRLFSYQFQQKDFAENASATSDRDGVNQALSGAKSLYFAKRKGALRLKYTFDLDAANDNQLDYQGHRLGVGGGYQLPWIRVDLDADYQGKRYRHPSTLSTATPKEKRRDDTTTVQVNLVYAYSKEVTLSLQMVRTDNPSNISPYSYQRSVYGVNLSRRF